MSNAALSRPDTGPNKGSNSGPNTGANTGAIWSALPLPAFVISRRDGVDILHSCNPAAEDFIATSAAVVSGLPVFDVLTLDAANHSAVDRARRTQSPVIIRDVEIAASGQPPIYCNLQLASLEEPAEGVLMLIAPHQHVGRIGGQRRVNAAANSAIGMSQMLAHEIKNPLAGITGAAQLLSMGLSGEDRELTDLIVEETRRIVALLTQVETFGDQRPPQRLAVNLHDVLERARRSAKVGFGAHMQILTDYDPSLPEVLADPDQLLQVILNLLKNASEAQGEGGTIRLRSFFERGLQVHGRDGHALALPLHVEVADDGPGLPQHIAENVFDPFISGRENGTGLGLALVSKIIAAHDGWIEVDSHPGHTVFRLSLPMAPTGKPPKRPDTRKAD